MSIPRPRYNNKKKRRQPGKFKRGLYRPLNEDKYKQPLDRTMNSNIYPEYRSSWELKFMQYLDGSDRILFWSTETFPIQYISPKDGQPHRYFVDFVFKTTDGEKHLVEIKPYNQKKMPVNIAKWEAAEAYCKKSGATFSVVTEKELKAWGLIK